MALDTSIAMGYKPIQIENPMNQLAKMMEIKNAQQQQELGEFKMREARNASDEINNLNALYAESMGLDGQIDRNKLFQGAAKRNLGSKIPGLQKGFMEADEAKGKVEKQKVDLVDSKLKQSRSLLDGITTAEEYIMWHEANHKDPVLGPVLAARGITADQSRQRIMQALQQSGGLERLINESKIGTEKFTELNKPTITKVDTNGEEILYATPGMGGAPTAISRNKKVVSPDTIYRENKQAEQSRLNRESTKTNTDTSKPPVAVVDPVTGQPVYVTREEALSKRMTPSSAMLGITPKEVQNREAKFPAATAAVKATLADSSQLEKDLLVLRDHTGLNGIVGVVYGRTPSLTPAAREAQAKLDKILARGGFQELAKMRAASPTGGALGNVSDSEGKYLRAAFGALDRTQATPSFQQSINDVVAELQASRGRIQDAYDNTYEYRIGRDATSTPAPAPGTPPGGAPVPPVTPPAAVPTTAPIYATNPTTKQRIMSTNGGQTWVPTR